MKTETKMKTPDEEIRELGNMLYATSADDHSRLEAICKRVGEISAAEAATCAECEEQISDDGDGHNTRCNSFSKPLPHVEIATLDRENGGGK